MSLEQHSRREGCLEIQGSESADLSEICKPVTRCNATASFCFSTRLTGEGHDTDLGREAQEIDAVLARR